MNLSMFNSEFKILVKKASILLLLTCLCCLFIDFIYRNVTHSEYNLPSHLLVNKSIQDKYQLVKVGNSHAEDSLTFEKYNLKSIDLAGVAQRFSYDLVLLKQHRKEIADNALVIISVSPISFSHKIADSSDGLQYNYFGAVSPFLIPDLKVSDYLQQEFFPFVRSGYLFRQWYSNKVNERISEEERWKEPEKKQASTTDIKEKQPVVEAPKLVLNIAQDEVIFNVEAIENELKNPSYVNSESYIDNMNFLFKKWYHTEEFDPKYFVENRKDLEELILYCLKNNWRPVLITIPISAVLQDGLLDDYMEKYLYENLRATNLHKVEYLDYSNLTSITKNNSLFSNADHLNKKGGAIFSYLLLKDLIERGYLEPAVDHYDYRPLYKETKLDEN